MTPRHLFALLCALLGIHLLVVQSTAAEPVAEDFGGLELGTGWTLAGGAAVDEKRGQTANGGSLRLPPGSSAALALGEADASGSLDLWIYDDLSFPKDPKVRRGGPRWGLRQSDGRVLTAGVLYAPYLAGQNTYAAGDYLPGKESPIVSVQYLGTKRVEGWRRWTFTMDPETGLSLAVDGKPVNAQQQRFDWNRTKFQGFNALVFFGDDQEVDGQTLWVDSVRATHGPPMRAVPTPPPPPPPAVPEQDPSLEGPAPELLAAVKGQHPRLFFGPTDLPALRAKAFSPAMKSHWDELLAYLPSCQAPTTPAFLGDATDGQRQGLWRMPTVAMHYLVTGDKASLERAVGYLQMLLDLPNWETGRELNAGMSSANIMVGAAICYDWLYDALEPAFRERFRQKLWYMARAQYHGGHLNKNKSLGYWQVDPQNNHRWHRNAGLALAVLTATEGKPEETWLLAQTAADLAFVAEWLPADGTSHESPTYLIFGLPHLTLALQAADRCLGTKYLDSPFAREVARFRVQSLTPGLNNGFQFGDSAGVGGYNAPLWLYTARHRLAHEQAAFEQLYAQQPKAFEFAWWNLLWKDPTLTGGQPAALPKHSFFPDLGLAYLRDSWAADGVAAMFKCGPLGGYRLNQYRNANDRKYVNVAHDDPDANSFTIFSQGSFVAETDRYSQSKYSANHNTILVNGKGQVVAGRPEGAGFTQPANASQDMSQLAQITAWLPTDDAVIIEGEAGPSYPELTRFRRTFIWVKGQYLLILDDLRASKEVEYTWLLQAPKLSAIQAPANELDTVPSAAAATDDGLERRQTPVLSALNHYELAAGAATCPVAIIADQPFAGEIRPAIADNRGKSLGWQQLRLRSKGQNWRVVSLYDPWRRGQLAVSFKWESADAATLTVTGGDIKDTWQWHCASGKLTPSRLTGRVTLDETHRPPQP